jgi:AcrR family transcriptional regulator
MLYSMSSRTATDTNAAILDAARELFETRGYHAVGLEAVAKQAGVSRQAIYLHFDSKASLLRALHRRVNERDVEPAMRKVWNRADARSGLDAFVAATAVAVPKILAIFNTLDTIRSVEPVVEETWKPPQEGRYGDCLRMAEWLETDGALADGVSARAAADVLFATVSVRVYESLVIVCGWSSKRWKTWTRRLLHTALLKGSS